MPSRDTRKLTLCRIDCKQQSPSIVLLFDSRRADNSRSGHETWMLLGLQHSETAISRLR